MFIHREEGVGDAVGKLSVLLFALLYRFLCLLALGDFHVTAQNCLFTMVVDGPHSRHNPDNAAISANDSELIWGKKLSFQHSSSIFVDLAVSLTSSVSLFSPPCLSRNRGWSSF